MIDLLCAIASVFILTAAMIIQPQRAQCPIGWYLLEGVRTDEWQGWPAGSFTCERPPIGGHDDVLTGKSTARDQPGTLRGRIYCSNGTKPIVVDARTVGCQR